jgi:2-C-methyl-D-erythritol 4-phosphate cytidylyltransferase/2-C-methyl-D-erythritol 2,4-cyclodiphosphate synthase
MKIGVVIVAAGRGERAGGGVAKQYRMLGAEPVLSRTLRVFLNHPDIDDIVTVIAAGAGPAFETVEQSFAGPLERVTGGQTRTASVRAGLTALADRSIDRVLIHDAARPFVSPALIDRLIDALQSYDAVIPALASTDALMRLDADGHVLDPVDRDEIFSAQTPQGFRLSALLAAYANLGDVSVPDDAAVARRAGMRVQTIPGDADNFKITTSADFTKAERMLTTHNPRIVTGQGVDVHRLEVADSMWLCGVEIREGLGLVGHSDADVGLHALTDAILGAAGAGDIGQHFPPSDPQWSGVSSDRFLARALDLLKTAGGELNHVDLTLIAERPKIAPYREQMRDRLCQLLDLDKRWVNLKATTTEQLGFTGRGEGMAAQAIITASMT